MPQSESLLPKRSTSFPLQLPGKWLMNNHITIKKPLKNYRESSSCARNSTNNNNSCVGGWVLTLLHECAKTIAMKNPSKSQQLVWVLNEIASAYGDCDQRLAYYFLQALFSKLNNSGLQLYNTLKFVEEKNYYYCFDTCVKLMLKFQEVSPWTTFGHVASNGAILEALEGETNLHIIDLSNTLCTQWPMLLEALATRNNDETTPHLRLTLVVCTSLETIIIKEITKKMEKFARLMGVPFIFHVIGGLDRLGEIQKEDLGLQDGDAVVVNCIQALQRVEVEKRGDVIEMIRSIKPRVVTIVEEEVDLTSTRGDFGKCFEECLRFYRLYFEMLEESFPSISNERLKLERNRFRNIANSVACENNNGEIEEEYWRPDKASQWTKRLREAFCPFHFNDEILGDVQALLRRYNNSWSLALPQRDHHQVGIHLKWRDELVVWTSAWKPSLDPSPQNPS